MGAVRAGWRRAGVALAAGTVFLGAISRLAVGAPGAHTLARAETPTAVPPQAPPASTAARLNTTVTTRTTASLRRAVVRDVPPPLQPPPTQPYRPTVDRVALAPAPDGAGYWILDADGVITTEGDAPFEGDLRTRRLTQPIVAMAVTPSGHGYWLSDAQGTVYPFGDAPGLSTTPPPTQSPVVAIASTASGGGYVLASRDGGVFAYGDAGFHGSAAAIPHQPIAAVSVTPAGYRLASADGGVYAFGDAAFAGSAATLPGHQPIVAMTATPGGYRLFASDGAVFAYGDATFAGRIPLPSIVSAGSTPGGYWMLSRDGDVFAFGVVTLHGDADGLAPVDERVETITDPTRPTPPRNGAPGHPGRVLPTTFFVPRGVSNAPVVVFAHGFNVNPQTYGALLTTWAAAGYLVAAPEFPLSGSDGPGPASESDLAEQPADLSAVIGWIVTHAGSQQSWLHGVADTTRIAETGQSDGGMTVAAATLNTAAEDPRIDAALVLSGAELTMAGGAYGQKPNVPVLVVQGDADDSNPGASAFKVYSDADNPKGWLQVIGGSHLGPYLDPTPQATEVRAATVGFLDLELKGEVDGRMRLERFGRDPGQTLLLSTLG